MHYRLIIKSTQVCAVTVDGKYLGDCSCRPLVVRAVRKGSYFIKAVFAPVKGVVYRDINFMFCPGSMQGSDSVSITRYSPQTFFLSLIPVAIACCGVFEPMQQVMFEQAQQVHTATLYSDGISYVHLECADSMSKKPITPLLTDMALQPIKLDGNSFLLISGKTSVGGYIFTVCYENEYTPLKAYKADSYTIENNNIILFTDTQTIRKHHVKSHYTYKQGQLIAAAAPQITPTLPAPQDQRLLPYLFLEAVMTGSDEEALGFLDPKQYKDTEFLQLQNYFGEFDGVFHNFYDQLYRSSIGISLPLGDNFFEAHYYCFDIDGGLIQNITMQD